LTAASLNSYITSASQISLPGLDITMTNQSEWFSVNVPATSTGTMKVSVQSSNLSSLSPQLVIYSSSLGVVSQVSAPNSLGATISATVPNVQYGQLFYVKVLQAGGPGPIGGYGLLVNFGNQPQAAIQPPNTMVGQQPDHGGGVINNAAPAGPAAPGPGGDAPVLTTIGSLTGWTESFAIGSPAGPGSPAPTNSIKHTPSSPSPAPGAVPSAAPAASTTTSSPAPAAHPMTASTPAVATLATTPNIYQAVDTAFELMISRRIKKIRF
jgi:hypothetical protein